MKAIRRSVANALRRLAAAIEPKSETLLEIYFGGDK
jgi:hypothetical protein